MGLEWLGAGWALISTLQDGPELQESRGRRLPGLLGASLEQGQHHFPGILWSKQVTGPS